MSALPQPGQLGTLGQQPQFAAQQAQTPPEQPFTQADSIEMQRLQAAQSEVQQKLGADEIDEPTAQAHHSNISRRLIPLQQKQQRHQAQMQQQAEQQELQASARQEGINAVHFETRAKNFPKTVGELLDPITGVFTRFLQNRYGEFTKEVKHEAHQAEEDRKQQARDAMLTPQTGEQEQPAAEKPPAGLPGVMGTLQRSVAGLAVGATPQEQSSTPPTLGEYAASKAAQEAPAAMTSGRQTPDIPNEFGTQPEQLQTSPVPGAAAPGQPQIITGPEHGGVKLGENPADFTYNQYGEVQRGKQAVGAHIEQEMMRRAQSAIPRPQRTGNPVIDAHAMNEWNHSVRSMANTLLTNHQRHEEFKSRQEDLVAERQRAEKARTEEHQRKEAATSAEMRTREAARLTLRGLRDNAGLTLPMEQKIYDKHHKMYEAQLTKFVADNPRAQVPDFLKDPAKAAWGAANEEFDRWEERLGIKEQAAAAKKAAGIASPATNPPPAGGVGAQATPATGTKPTGTDPAVVMPPHVPPEVLAKDSPVGPERMRDLLGTLHAGLEEIPLKERIMTPLATHMRSMRDLLMAAQGERRNLSIGESLKYHTHYEAVDKLLKEHGGAKHLALEK